MQNFHQSGDVLDLAPTVAVANGAGNLFGPALFGVAQQAVAANTVGAFRIRGVVTLAKTAGLAIPIGSRVFWDAANKVVSLTATGNVCVGVAVAAAAAGDAGVKIRLGASTPAGT